MLFHCCCHLNLVAVKVKKKEVQKNKCHWFELLSKVGKKKRTRNYKLRIIWWVSLIFFIFMRGLKIVSNIYYLCSGLSFEPKVFLLNFDSFFLNCWAQVLAQVSSLRCSVLAVLFLIIGLGFELKIFLFWVLVFFFFVMLGFEPKVFLFVLLSFGRTFLLCCWTRF
jgi:hypothetical protein